MKDLISIIVPIYNVEKYLKTCLNSIVNQTYRNLEIILVDDGSPDQCGEICDEYAEKDDRIKVIHKENGGLSDARNAGINIASGKYIAFIDSDDYIADNFIQYLYDLCEGKNADMAECQYIEFKEESKNENDLTKKEDYIVDVEQILEMLYSEEDVERISTTVVWNKLYKRELFDTIRFPKGKIHEDEFITYKLYWKMNSKIAITNQKLYYYRNRVDSITGNEFNKKRLDYIEALQERLEFFKEKDKKILYEKTLEKYAYILIKYYFITKKQIPNSQKEQKEIWQKFKRNYKEFTKIEKTQREKIKYLMFRYFPRLLELLRKMKLRKR